MKVLITGESHTAALYWGQKQIEKENNWAPSVDIIIRPLGGGHILPTQFFIDRGDHAEITVPQYRRQFRRLPLDDGENANTMYGLCAPLHTARVWRHHDWRLFAPVGVRQQEAPISSGMLRRVILDDQKYVLELIDVFVRTGKRVFAIEAPHPFRHHHALKTVRRDLILYVNRTYREIIRSELANRSVPIVSVPAQCLDGVGFMREEYGRKDDSQHGNAKFGRLMMKEISAFLEHFPI
jgi:hypothetical protein